MPSDWKEIGIDVDVNGVIEGNRRSFAESPNDILRRMLLGQPPPPNQPKASPAPPLKSLETSSEAATGGLRITGRWAVEFQNRRVEAPNLKSAYRSLLLLLNEAHPNFLEQFSKQGGRGRRFVARSARDLYLSSPELAPKHGALLADGWFFDTNLSTDQVGRRARIAARVCGLRYGTDLRITHNGEQI